MNRGQTPANARDGDDTLRGIGAILLSMMIFALMNVLVKDLDGRYPFGEVAFFRSFFAIPPGAVLVALNGGFGQLRSRHPWSHLWRGASGMASMTLMFFSFSIMPLADAVALSFSAPLFLSALAVPLLGERLGRARGLALLAGFIGVAIMAHPSGDLWNSGTPLVLLGAVFYALAMISIRHMRRTESAQAIVFHYTWIGAAIGLLLLPFGWITPAWSDLPEMIAMGVIGTIAQYIMTVAYRLAPAGLVGSFTYSSILWATLVGWLVWGETPTGQVLIGAAIVVGSGIALLLQETRGSPASAPAALQREKSGEAGPAGVGCRAKRSLTTSMTGPHDIATDRVTYSVVIPVFNEADNVGPLLAEIHAALASPPRPAPGADQDAGDYEVIFVDDASTDDTARRLAPHLDGRRVRLVRHGRRSGQSAALRTGVKAARGVWIATLDGDGQNDPADIPALIAVAGPTVDLVGGLRLKRQDTLSKRWASRFANALRKALLDDGCPDTGCGLKLFRRDAFLDLPYFGALHRFLPALFQIHGRRTTFVPVNHRPRQRGQSKYGNLSRGLVGIVDLLGVFWLKQRTRLPGTASEQPPQTAAAPAVTALGQGVS